nr:hypothetical protein BaRGS_033887 [Batillaria attramentaria]
MNRGQVIDHQFVVDESEPGYVVNIKRAIVSQLQLYILSPRDYDRHVDQYDIFGSCPTRYTFSRESVSTQRDIIRCDVPQVLRRLKSYLSLARQIDTAVLSKPLHELVYPFESTVECTYRLSSQRAIANSECVQVQAFRPVTFHGNLRSTSTSTITQSLSLKQVSKIPRRKSVISRGLEGRRIVDLAMELDLPPAREVTSADLFAQLQGLMESYTSQSEALPPERFQEMVDLLRDAREDILEEVLETLLACRAATGCPLEGFGGKLDPKVVQKLRESLFTDGLLSCGTEPCIATYMTSLQRGMVYSVQGELTLFNMALFYQPTPAILGKMLTLCKSQSSNNCWLTLGTFVNKMAEEVKMSEDKALRDEGAAAIRDVLQHLRVVVGDTCRTGILPEKLKDEHMDIISALLIALKTLANAGGAIQEYHDDVTVNGKDLVPAILNCVENSALPLKISQAAILVLRKVELRKDVRVALTDILSDISRPASLRTEAFDLLLGHEHVDTVRSLLKAMQTEKLSSFQLYMVTRVGHLLESNSPHTASLRKLWRETMIQETARLPELESIKGRGSQYMEFSRYIQLPPMGLPLGGQLGLRVVFDPSTVLPSTIRVALMATFGNSSVEIVELGLDIQGVENIVREVFMSDLNIRRDGPGALIAKIMQAALPKTGGPPTFFFPDENVVESLKKLFLQVNMPTGDVPQAHFHLRILGSDVGFVYLEDLIQMVKQSSRGNDKRPPRVMTLMQQLAQGLNLFVGKSLKMVELEKTIPTVGGFPWQAKVHGTMVASAVLDAGGDIMSFLQRKRPLEINGGLRTSVAVKVWCQQTVRIGDATSAGLRLNMSVLVNGVVGGRMKYAPVRETTSTPGAMKLELALSALKQPLNVIRLRSDIYFLHNDIVQPVTNPASEISVKKCAADAFEKWTGQKVCLDGVYQPVGFAPDTPFPPLSGPIHLDVIARPLDKSLEEYKVIFTLTRKDEKDQPGMTVVFRADHSAEGEKMKRHLNISLELNTATKEAHLEAVVPEIGLQYDLDLRTTYGSKNSAYHGVSSVLTVGPKLLHSFITEYKDEEDQQTVVNPQTGQPMKLTLSDSVLKLNVSVPGLSMEIFTSSVSSKPPGRFSQAMVLRYYCEPQLGIFYSLHPNPEQAAENGHMSEYSFHNEATMTGTTFESMTGVSQADFWRALDTMVIMIPGHNVTLLNQMAANHSFAERDTTIYWTSGIGSANESLDIIHMDAEVNNKSKDRHHSFHYKMDLDHVDKYDIMLQGSMEGALHDLNFHTHVTYKTKPRPETAEEAAEESIVSIEETVLRRGAELTVRML